MKYKLINRQTGKEHLCEKVTIDRFDYYLGKPVNKDGENLKHREFYIEHTQINPDKFSLYKKEIDDDSFENSFTIAATTNPDIDAPQVVDEVEELVSKLDTPENLDQFSFDKGFIEGYNKSQETHPFSAEDMIEFLNWVGKDGFPCINSTKKGLWILHPLEPKDFTPKELLQLWKEQQPKVIYYNTIKQ